jgi:hypothetical protein
MKRITDVLRLHATNWAGLIAWPLGILAVTFVVNFGIFAALEHYATDYSHGTGAVVSIYIVMLVAHLQSMTQLFPFALGLGVTRRDFYTGTLAAIAAQSAAFGLVLTILERVESATDGWGIQMQMFALPFLHHENLVVQWLVFSVPFLAFTTIGLVIGVTFKRWGQQGVYLVSIATTVVVALLALLATARGWWPKVGSFFADSSTLALLCVYPLALAVACAGLGYLAIRRAVP